MRLSRLISIGLILPCLGLALSAVGTEAKEDVPQGYEDAPQAGAKPPVAKPAQAAQPRPVAAAYGPAPQKRPAKKVKREDLPQGYEDAPEANANAPVARAEAPVMLGAPVGAIAVAPKENEPAKDDPRIAQMEQQYRPQFQRMLDSELAFLRRACDLDQPQREAAAKAGPQCMSSVLRRCVVAQWKMERQQNMNVCVDSNESNALPGPRKLLREQLAEVVGKSLRPEQLERYGRESKQRDASRKRAVASYMVSRADQTLMLSVEQREKLLLALTEHYSDAWERTISIWRSNPQYMPTIMDAQITPLLNENQKAVWQKIQKVNFGVSMQMDFQMDSGMAVIKE